MAKNVAVPETSAITVTASEPATPMTLIQTALEKGMAVENLGKLMDLQERWEKNEAAKAYAQAITDFQSKMPPVVKGNAVKDKSGNQMYLFANHDDIMEIAQPILNACGIAVTFSTEITPEKLMKTTCHVRVGIHVEHASAFLALPKIPNANEAQMAGAALSYGKRYSIIAALNIRVKGEDNDAGNLAEAETLDSHEIDHMHTLIEDRMQYPAPADYLPRFLKWLDVPEKGRVSDIARSNYKKAVEELERQIAKCKKEAK